MSRIRDKSLQSRRMGATLNGLGQEFDQTDWSGDYEQLPTSEWTGGAVYADAGPQTESPNVLSDLLKFGTKLLAPQPTQQPQQRITTTQAPVKRAAMNMPLLIAAGLVAVLIATRK